MKTDSRVGVVKKMREIREQFSIEIMNMTFEEEKAYLNKLISESNAKFVAQNSKEINFYKQ